MFKSLLLIFFSMSLAIGGQLLLKSGMNNVGPITEVEVRDSMATVTRVATNYQVILGLLVYMISAASWMVVLSRVDLSFAYPIMGTSYIIIMAASRLLFNEAVTPARWAGAALISLGVLMITRT